MSVLEPYINDSFFIFLNPSLNTVSTEVASVQWQVYKSVGSDS